MHYISVKTFVQLPLLFADSISISV